MQYKLIWVGGYEITQAIPDRIERAEADGWEFCQVISISGSFYLLVRK